MTGTAPVPSSGRLTPAQISDRLLRQALEEAEMATGRVIELTQQVIELKAEIAELHALIGLSRGEALPVRPDDQEPRTAQDGNPGF